MVSTLGDALTLQHNKYQRMVVISVGTQDKTVHEQ